MDLAVLHLEAAALEGLLGVVPRTTGVGHEDGHAHTGDGDTVGDPFKDTAGPSLNILVKLMSVVALVLAPLLI